MDLFSNINKTLRKKLSDKLVNYADPAYTILKRKTAALSQ